MDKEQFLNTGLLEQYVLGLTSDAESRQVEAYLEKFPELLNTKREIEFCMEQIAMESAIPTPQGLKGKIMADIDGQAPSQTDTKIPTQNNGFLKTMLGLAAATILGISVFAYSLYQDNKSKNEELSVLSGAYSKLQDDCQSQKYEGETLAIQNKLLQDAKTVQVYLLGSSLSPEANAIAFWNEEKKDGYLNIVNLPVPPADKQYQIWADVEGEMINMGVIDLAFNKLIKLLFIEHAESLNITLEPLGGSEEPDVEQIYISGKV